MEALRGEAHSRFAALNDEVGELGLRLIGNQGLLPEDIKLALAELSVRRMTRKPLFRLIHAMLWISRRRPLR
jgi:hypothetical protein